MTGASGLSPYFFQGRMFDCTVELLSHANRCSSGLAPFFSRALPWCNGLGSRVAV